MWDIASQTEIKLAILRKYLRAWATILKSNEILYYVDGFAGPGWLWQKKHESREKVPGSPVQTVQLYLDHRKEKGWSYELRFINVEKDRAHFQELVKETSRFVKDAKISNIQGEFLDNLQDIMSQIGECHSFFFIDPFGISGIEFSELESVLERDKTEILLNFNYNGLRRCIGEVANLEDPDLRKSTKARKTIDRVCRMLNLKQQDLEDIVETDLIPKRTEVAILRKYRDNLQSYKRFVYPLPLNFPYKKRTFYYLIFMSDNITGLKIMKDVMHAEIDRELRQLFLFPHKTDVHDLSQKLLTSYQGRSVPFSTILQDLLPKCQSINGEDYKEKDIRAALKLLDAQGSVQLIRKPEYRYPLCVFGKE